MLHTPVIVEPISSPSSTNSSSPSISTTLPSSDIHTTLSQDQPSLPSANEPNPLPFVIEPITSSHPMQTRAKFGIFKPKQIHLTFVTGYLNTEPPAYKIAYKLPQWQDATTSEFEALQQQATWTLVPPSSNHNLVGCRWVYN